MDSRTQEVLKALEAPGFNVRRTSGGHYFVTTKDGQPVTTFAGTPSDHRSFRNALAAARRAGFQWPR